MSCPSPPIPPPILSREFFRRGYEMCQRLGIDWLNLLVAMNFESIGVNPGACNPGSHAAGLIQIINLKGCGWNGTREAFLRLYAEDQLPYVEAYLRPWAKYGLNSFARIHQAIFLPGSLSSATKPDDIVCSSTGTRWKNASGVPMEPVFYSQNTVFDIDKKGYITLGDIEASGARAAQTSRFVQVLSWLKAAVPEMAGRIPDRISPVEPPAAVEPWPSSTRASAAFPWALAAATLLAGGTLVFLTRKDARLPNFSRLRFA